MARRRADRKLDGLLPTRGPDLARRIWAEAAEAAGGEFVELTERLYALSRNDVGVYVLGQWTPFVDPVAIALTEDKTVAYQLIADAGVPTPERVAVPRRDYSGAFAFLQDHSPCVVKPSQGAGGQGVTGSVVTRAQLGRAMRRAGLSSETVIVEHQVAGDHYRVLLLDGEVLDVVLRGRPQVVGDGTRTIEELMFAEYERRLDCTAPDGLKPFAADLDCLCTLESQGLRLSTVLSEGRAVPVKTATNTTGGRESRTVRAPLAPELEAEVARAAAAVGVRLAGVDIITRDPSVSLAAGGGVALEVNPVPALSHHYNVADPTTATRVAIPILEALFTQARARRSREGARGPRIVD